MLPAVPAVSLVANPVTVKIDAAAACTVIPDSAPVMVDVFVSVAVIALGASRLEREREGIHALIRGREGSVRRQAGAVSLLVNATVPA